MFTKWFWVDAAERSVATVAQTFLALVGTNAVDLVDVNLGQTVIASIVAGVISLAKSVAALRLPNADGSASLINDKE